MNRCYKYTLLVLLILSAEVVAESRIEIKKDVIKGNSELPKVLYIIPWQNNVTRTQFKGVKLENFYEKLLVPHHPHKSHDNDNN